MYKYLKLILTENNVCKNCQYSKLFIIISNIILLSNNILLNNLTMHFFVFYGIVLILSIILLLSINIVQASNKINMLEEIVNKNKRRSF